ncbi:MAG: hypothetical protein M3321_04810 [Actinomycetota bacterium]|nr:hypothetical protein [Actinomycetota bacterium]
MAGSLKAVADALGAPFRELAEAFSAPWREIGEAWALPWQEISRVYAEQWRVASETLTERWQELARSLDPSRDVATLHQELTAGLVTSVLATYADQHRQLASIVRDALEPVAQQAREAAEQLAAEIRAQSERSGLIPPAPGGGSDQRDVEGG